MAFNIKALIGAILGFNVLVCLILYRNAETTTSKFLGTQEPFLGFENRIIPNYYYSEPWKEYLRNSQFHIKYQRIEDNDNYCSEVAEYQEKNPVQLDENNLPLSSYRVFCSDYLNANLVKDVMRETGQIVLKKHTIETSPETPLEQLPPNINMFFHKSPSWHRKHKIDVHFLCEGQRYNHIEGHQQMVYKDGAARACRDYGKYYSGRKDCFNPWAFMPETFDLSDREDCLKITKYLLSDPNPDNVKWIKKKSRNSHNAKGVTVLTRENSKALLEEYEYGSKCGTIEDKYIVQRYIQNPLLLEGKKFDFRVYLLVANTDPLILLYHDGFLRFSYSEYNGTSTEMTSHITNTAIVKDLMKHQPSTKASAMEDQMWTFERFEDFIVKKMNLTENWLESYVRPAMKKNMLHLIRMHIHNFLLHPRTFELFGVDFIFDENLHLWFLEVNRSPAMQATTFEKGRIQSKLVKELFELEFALMYNADFDKVLSQTNWEKVYDGRLSGFERYQGLLEEHCV